jgi:hypothetical protein
VRKIISILVTVGLVMAFSAVAMPTAGQTCVGATVTLDPATACECASTEYTITVDFPVTLLAGNDMISVEFGAGTTFAFLSEADIDVGGHPVDDLDDVVITGTKIEFLVPIAHGHIDAGDTVVLTIDKVNNPCVAGEYELTVDYSLACCEGVTFACGEYEIFPAVSEYDFFWDSSVTYDGDIAFDFVPPFKVCGQDNTDYVVAPDVIDGKDANWVNIYFMPETVGCLSPCTVGNVTFKMILTAAPAGANVTFSINGTDMWFVFDPEDDPPELDPLAELPVGNNDTILWEMAFHFDTVGDYQICFEAWCPADWTCPTCSTEPTMIAEKCYDIEVFQHKDAVKIPLYRKWNLISLPLVPLEDPNFIEDVLAAHSNPALIEAVYYYDRCADAWSVWGNGQSSLDTMEDGKGYWVKVDYDHADSTKQPGEAIAGLWVWGTPQPVPPNAPSAYPVCEGWNMVGLTGYDDNTYAYLGTILEDDYFWSVTYGALWAFDGDLQEWHAITSGQWIADLQVGEGYWLAAGADGMILPP